MQMIIGMDTQRTADIKKTDLSVAANIESVGPKRNAILVNNAQREAVILQAKASERAQNSIIGEDRDPAVNAMKWIDERYFNMLQESTSQGLGLSKLVSSVYELDRLSVMTSAVDTVLKARQEQLMRTLLFLDR